VATGNDDQVQSIINKQGLIVLKNVLTSPYVQNKSQAIWAFGNIAGDCSDIRDLVLKEGVLPIVAQSLTPTAPYELMKSCTWCIQNLCRGKPEPKLSLVLPALKPITEILTTQKDIILLSDCAWALWFISDGGGQKIPYILATNIVPTLVKLISHPESKIAVPCLRVIGNITTGTDEETQTVVDAGGLAALKTNVQATNINFRKEVFWVISNIAAGTTSQTLAIINAGIIESICKVLKEDGLIVKVEAMWTLANLTNRMDSSSTKQIMDSGLISLIPILLKENDTKLLAITLQFIANILKHAKEIHGNKNIMATQIEQLGCLEILEQLQYHNNQFIYKFANEIIGDYFIDECVEETLYDKADSAHISIFNT